MAVLLKPVIFIIECILRVSALSLDLAIGDDVRMDTLKSIRLFAFNQSIHIFLFPIRMARYCCPRSCFPRVCQWMHTIHRRISHQFVAGFIYHFINLSIFFCGYLCIALIFVFPNELDHGLSIFDAMVFMVMFTSKAVIISAFIQWRSFVEEEDLLGAGTTIPMFAFYVRNLKVHAQRMLFLYTIKDQLDEARARREAFETNAHKVSLHKLPIEMNDLIFRFDSKDMKPMVAMMHTAEAYTFPYYGFAISDDRADLHFMITVTRDVSTM